jgi:predicted DNA-binding transcriptional regulator AlpA
MIASTEPRAATARTDPFEGLPVLISVPRAAHLLGLSRATAYRLAATDVLPVRRLAGRVYVITGRLAAFVEGDQGVA